MNRFKDMVAAGIAPGNYQMDTQPDHPTLDPIVRHYNNYWGLISDTHCATTDGKTYIVTGQLAQQPERFERLINEYHWQAMVFPNRQAWTAVMQNLGLTGDFQTINGALCYVMTKAE